jgi:hypothetical protein
MFAERGGFCPEGQKTPKPDKHSKVRTGLFAAANEKRDPYKHTNPLNFTYTLLVGGTPKKNKTTLLKQLRI